MAKLTRTGPSNLPLLEWEPNAQAMKVTPPVLAPGIVVTDDISAGWVRVGKGNILRIQVGSDTYVACTDDPSISATISSSTSPAVKLAAGYYLVEMTGEFVAASANPTRIEKLVQ